MKENILFLERLTRRVHLINVRWQLYMELGNVSDWLLAAMDAS
jgi:hypothetical protein